MEKKTTIIVAVVVAVIVVAAAISAVVIVNNNNNKTPDTKDSVVGCYFDYKVVGDVTDKYYPLSGTYKMKITDESETQYRVEYDIDTYYTNETGIKTTFLKKVDSKWEDKTELIGDPKDATEKKINTMWGEQNCNKYVIDDVDAKATDTVYAGYNNQVIFEEVLNSNDSDNPYIFIIMLKDTDFINKGKSDALPLITMTADITGKATYSKTTYDITGSMKYEMLDQTGTCYQTKSTTTMKYGTEDPTTTTETRWTEDTESEEGIGVKTTTEKLSTSKWGGVEVDVYEKTESTSGYTNVATTYVYKDTVPLKFTMLSTSTSSPSTYSYEMSIVFTSFAKDGKDVTDLDDILDIPYLKVMI